MLPSAAELVARFLRANGYLETLNSFTQEADLSPDIGSDSSNPITIESILLEKEAYDTTLQLEKFGLDDAICGWSSPFPMKATIVSTLPNRSNVLTVSTLNLLLPSRQQVQPYISVTTADRKMHLLDPTSPMLDLVQSYSSFLDSPILDALVIGQQHILCALMSGKLILYDTIKNEILGERKDHAKYNMRLASWTSGNTCLIASAGYAHITLYQLPLGVADMGLADPFAVIDLPTVPETILFVNSPEDGSPILVITRRDSTYIHYYSVCNLDSPAMIPIGRQNLAPHSTAWVAFTPSDVQICPTDPLLVAVGTSSTPHMKLMIVRLLIPAIKSSLLETGDTSDEPAHMTQASQARAELLVQDREEAAILVNVSTLAPQTQYSTPRLTWRPDGSGVYVSSDDGVIRGIEASSGKLVSSLEGHDVGSKLRCLSSGNMTVEEDSHSQGINGEYLLSGGFDQKMIVWSS